MKKIFFFLAAMALAITANAKVTTISPDAENDALRLAVHYAEDGDIIEMTEGTYVQCNNGYVAFDGKAVTVRAAEGANVVLQPQVRITLANGGKATFENIKIDASRIHELADWYEHVFYVADDTEGKELVMEGCEFYGFDLNKSAIYSKATNKLDLCSLTNCYFHNNDKSCLFFEGESLGELSITNSTFANITAKVTDSYYAGVVDVRNSAAKVTIDHCTFYNCLLMNTDYAAITMKGPQAANVVISNNIFMLPEAIDGHRAIRENVEATNCMTFNYVKDNGGIHSSVTKTNCQLNVDPKFVDAANGNFALADGSPALTAGTDGKAIGDPRWNVVAEPEPTTETVYFINTKKWAAVTAHAWGAKLPDTTWPGLATVKEAEQIAGYDVYSFTANVGDYAKVIFNNKGGGSQTPDLDWTAGKYYVIDMGWLTKEEAETKLAAPLPEVWTIVGAAGLMGKDWDLNAAENAMTKQDDGTYKLEKKGITLTAGTYEYKAAKDHGWDVSVPAGQTNQKLTISTSGIYDVTFVLNVTAKTLQATATLKQAAVIIPTVVIAGDMNSWSTSKDKFTMSADSLTATFKTTLAVKNYGFKMVIGGNWQSDGKTITRAANSTKFTGANGGNSTLKADIAGEYLFTWEYATKTLTVTYPALPVKYNVTVTAEHGTVTGAGEYEEGKTATLTATPAEGYQFVNWTKGEEVVSTENPYKFTVTADVALVANFELIPPTKYNVTVTAENGTVEGAGEYEEGTTATLTATANEGYEFVNWTVGEEVVSTENPYTFTVTADIALVANFELIPVVEPEKPEPTYTENNLNPYAFGLESVLSEDKTTLTVTYRLNNSNATSVNVLVYNGEEVVATVAGTTTIGKNTVEVATADLPGGVELTWSVEVNGTSVKAPTQETKIYSIYHPSSVDIDNNPENPTFGMLLVNEAMQSVKTTTKETAYISKGFGAGIFAFTPSFDLMPNGELPGYNGGKTFSTAANMFAPRRIRFSKDGRIFATAQDGSGEYLWEINPENLNEWTTVFQGTNDGYTLKDAEGNFIAGTNSGFDVRGEGENLQLLMLSASLPGAQVCSFKCHTYDLGTATTWATAPTKEIPGANYMLVTNQSNVQFDKDGGVWYISYRGTTTEKEPGLVHINKDGVEDYKELRHMTRNAGFRFNHDFTKVIIAGNNGASKKATIYAMSEDANGAPVLTQETVIDMSAVGANLNDFAWDYAGNLYACGNSSEKLAAWAMPYSGTVETPAASQYAFQVEGSGAGEYYEDVITNMTFDLENMVIIGGPSENFQIDVYLVLGEDDGSGEFQLTEESSVAVMGSDAKFIEGIAYEIDAYAPAALVDLVVEWNGNLYQFHLTMSAAPIEATVVVVENATIEVEKYQLFGDTYGYALMMTGVWTDAEGLDYPVTVDVPVYYPEATEPYDMMSTVTVGTMTGNWLGFGEGYLTITTVGDVVTATGVVENPSFGIAIDITISGSLSQGPGTGLENATITIKAVKMIQNGQLIIRKGDVEYNVQGQVIK